MFIAKKTFSSKFGTIRRGEEVSAEVAEAYWRNVEEVQSVVTEVVEKPKKAKKVEKVEPEVQEETIEEEVLLTEVSADVEIETSEEE